MKFCPQCGAAVDETSKFCTSCGATIEVTAPSYPYAPDSVQPVQTIDGKTPGKTCGVLSLIFGIFGVLHPFHFLAGVIGTILGGVSKSRSKKAGKTNGTGIAGLTLSITALVIAVLEVLMLFIGVAIAVQKLKSVTEELTDADWEDFLSEITEWVNRVDWAHFSTEDLEDLLDRLGVDFDTQLPEDDFEYDWGDLFGSWETTSGLHSPASAG